MCAQLIVESQREREAAHHLIGHIRAAYPEVLTGIKTKQLAQEMLLFKEDHIDDVARTGAHAPLAYDLTDQSSCEVHALGSNMHGSVFPRRV